MVSAKIGTKNAKSLENHWIKRSKKYSDAGKWLKKLSDSKSKFWRKATVDGLGDDVSWGHVVTFKAYLRYIFVTFPWKFCSILPEITSEAPLYLKLGFHRPCYLIPTKKFLWDSSRVVGMVDGALSAHCTATILVHPSLHFFDHYSHNFLEITLSIKNTIYEY